MKAQLVFFGALLISLLSTGQVNLVPNPSFEDSIPCLNTIGTYRPADWYSPTSGSPDYYVNSSIGNNGCFDQWQYSWGGGSFNNSRGFQIPNNGKAYIGFGMAAEFVAVKLTDTLSVGNTYEVSFYASLAEISGAGMDMINVSFMHDSVTGYSNLQLFLDSLIIEGGNSAGNCIVDTANWILVRDTFISSGGERYLVFGDMNEGQETYCTVDSSLSQGSYYYFDDFDVHCIDCIADTFEPPIYPEMIVTPNIGNGEITLSGNFPEGTKFEVYDMLGQLVYDNELQSGNKTQQIFLQLSAGVYSYRVVSNNNVLKADKLVMVR